MQRDFLHKEEEGISGHNWTVAPSCGISHKEWKRTTKIQVVDHVNWCLGVFVRAKESISSCWLTYRNRDVKSGQQNTFGALVCIWILRWTCDMSLWPSIPTPPPPPQPSLSLFSFLSGDIMLIECEKSASYRTAYDLSVPLLGFCVCVLSVIITLFRVDAAEYCNGVFFLWQ